jgi:acetyl-CoA/propionyl-CoA carboxylase, biotin carboxylase, biotin carboxyl carrier protein
VFRKVLVANRGEIAIRVFRTLRELGIGSVGVYSEVDRDAPFVAYADEAFLIGPGPAAESYLKYERIIETAVRAGAQAVHPGYGFLAENATFARACAAAGLVFIGPSPEAIDAMGSKIQARALMDAAGVPIVPGVTDAVETIADARAVADAIGYPVAVKAAAGGGGKGFRVALTADELEDAFEGARREAEKFFADTVVYLERYLPNPRHVEIQILADGHGNCIWLGERDCSVQRRHQKLVEETPSPVVSDGLRARMGEASVRAARAVDYVSAGTLEYLVSGEEFFFLEMNTRIQVEHTVTEMTWGLDLVKAQIRVATGEALWFSQDELSRRGHAIECRINAESPAHDFGPCAGRIERYVEPGGPGVRVDAAAYAGFVIPQEYDSLLGKLIVWGGDREEARRRMLRALGEYRIDGVDTTIAFLRMLLADDEFARGDYATPNVERFCQEHAAEIAAAYPAARAQERGTADAGAQERGTTDLTVEVNGKRFVVRVQGNGEESRTSATRRTHRLAPLKRSAANGPTVTAPMHGIVAEIRVVPGDTVEDGQVVAVIEAMKMMNEVIAHRSGTVSSIAVKAGDAIETGATLITFKELAAP